VSLRRANWPTLVGVAALGLALLQFLFGDNLVGRIPAAAAETVIRLVWQVGPAAVLLAVVTYLLSRVRGLRRAEEDIGAKLSQEQTRVEELQVKLEATTASLAKTEGQLRALRRSVEEQRKAERDRRTVQPVPHNPPGGLLDFDLRGEALSRGYVVALEAVREDAPDVALAYMSITFEPYIKRGCPVIWAYSFFSPTLRCSYYYSCFPGSPIQQVGPSRPEPRSTVFTELPWIACRDWLDSVREAYKQVGPLPHADETRCSVFVSAAADGSPRWSAQFDDGATGHRYKFQWTFPADLQLVDSTRG